MDKYVTGAMIKKLRCGIGMTQQELAQRLFVSDKAVSKWETGKGYPDITMIDSLAEILGVSVIELISGNNVTNRNKSFNIKRMKFYVCPICGNILFSTGEAVISCCGVALQSLEAESIDMEHTICVERVEDEYYITMQHDMSKLHYISFIAAVKDNGCEIVKLYPEGNAEARFKVSRTKDIYFYCNRHGLFKYTI